MLAAANFVYVFSSADDVMPPVKLPLHALCTEDLGFAAQERGGAHSNPNPNPNPNPNHRGRS